MHNEVIEKNISVLPNLNISDFSSADYIYHITPAGCFILVFSTAASRPLPVTFHRGKVIFA